MNTIQRITIAVFCLGVWLAMSFGIFAVGAGGVGGPGGGAKFLVLSVLAAIPTVLGLLVAVLVVRRAAKPRQTPSASHGRGERWWLDDGPHDEPPGGS